jgi:UDP-glucose 4-epimerase
LKRAVITGPTGAIGTALIAELISHGIEVEAVVRPDSRRTDNIPKSPLVHIVPCDLKELKTLHEKIEHADVFYHFGWDGTFGNSRNNAYGQLENVRYALDAVEAAAALGCTTFVGAGSQAEYGRVEGSLNASTPAFPENGYGIAKLCTGQMTKILCEQKGIRHIWTRILSIYGPFDGAKTMVMSTIVSLLKGRSVPQENRCGITFTARMQDMPCIFSEKKACPVRLTVSAVERQDRFGNTSKQSVMRQHRGQRLDLEKFLIRKSR